MVRIYPIVPVPAPRQVRRDAWKPSASVQRYRAYRDEVQLRHVEIPSPYYHVVFVLPMPASWSVKLKAQYEGQPHQQTPDKDNLEKALLDSVYGNDCAVWDGRASKVWGKQGLIVVSAESFGFPLNMQLLYETVRPRNFCIPTFGTLRDMQGLTTIC